MTLLSKGISKGMWWPWKTAGGMRAMLRCPDCGIPAFLEKATISPEGDVSPPFACRCGFRDDLKLDGWERKREPSDPAISL